ncbi:hypothetical protein IFR05_010339 [Cadophora sp. M221]|nr:hypothetical protein IFR05_010339 [Cadophora sp. M221]
MARLSMTLVLLWTLVIQSVVAESNGTLGSNSSVSCDGTSAADVIDDIKLNNINVTVLVATCNRVCSVALGSGNPVALAFLFEPLLPLVVRISKKLSFQPILRRVPLLERLLLSVTQTSSFYSLSLYIAAWVLYCQKPTISEFIILDPLLYLQMMTTSYLLIGLLFEHALGFTMSLGWIILSTVLLFFQILTWILIREKFSTAPKEDLSYYQTLAEACHSQYNIMSSTSYPSENELLNTTSYFTPDVQRIRSSSATLVVIMWTAALAGGCLLWLLISILWKRLPTSFTNFIDWKEWMIFLANVCCLGDFYFVVSALLYLTDAQRRAQHVSIDEFQDNSWGYGQTTAVLIWVPFLFEAVKETFKHERKLRAVQIQQPVIEIELQESNTTNETPRPLSGSISNTDREAHQRTESSDSSNRLIQQDPDAGGDKDDNVSGLSRRDTEARIEGRGGGGQETMERAVTWQDDRLQDLSAAHRLRRRFT